MATKVPVTSGAWVPYWVPGYLSGSKYVNKYDISVHGRGVKFSLWANKALLQCQIILAVFSYTTNIV